MGPSRRADGHGDAPNAARLLWSPPHGGNSRGTAPGPYARGHVPPSEAPVTTPPTNVPSLDELLQDAPSNWGKWGDDDEVGSLNYLGPEEVLAAVGLVRQGKV